MNCRVRTARRSATTTHSKAARARARKTSSFPTEKVPAASAVCVTRAKLADSFSSALDATGMIVIATVALTTRKQLLVKLPTRPPSVLLTTGGLGIPLLKKWQLKKWKWAIGVAHTTDLVLIGRRKNGTVMNSCCLSVEYTAHVTLKVPWQSQELQRATSTSSFRFLLSLDSDLLFMGRSSITASERARAKQGVSITTKLFTPLFTPHLIFSTVINLTTPLYLQHFFFAKRVGITMY